jgi:glyoxylase-like metal-dependent hydrolase (beta-lactamase superfamily II)/predicted ester cyclase
VAEAADKTTAKTRGSTATDTTPERKPSKRFKKSISAEEVARAYFECFEKPDLDRAFSFWAEGGLERIAPIGELRAPDEVRAFFTQLYAAFPDMRFEVLDLIPSEEKVAVRWRSTGTFCGAQFQGIDPTGAQLDLEGIDMLTIEGGLIRRNDAYYDGTQFARQIGLLPERDSSAERRMASLFNLRTRISAALFSPSKEQVAEGVWLMRGGFPAKSMNVYLIEDDGGITLFDAGIESMTRGLASAGAQMGGIKRIVLGHGHADHRGAAPGLGVPAYCHPDEVTDAEADGGEHYFDFSKLERRSARMMMPRLLRWWDGGPVKIEGTVKEGDEIAGFEVIHFPGHAPGLIGLWRESDRLALVSDTLYTLDPETGRHGPPRVPHRAFNKDTEQARASIRKLAAMEPAEVWPGHADPVKGDVREQLERAADTT